MGSAGLVPHVPLENFLQLGPWSCLSTPLVPWLGFYFLQEQPEPRLRATLPAQQGASATPAQVGLSYSC